MKNKLTPPFISRSTITFTKEARKTSSYSFWDWLHGLIYARFPYLYIAIGTGEHPIARFYMQIQNKFNRFRRRTAKDLNRTPPTSIDNITFADTYHGKVVPLKAATELVLINRDIRITNLEKIIPYARARDIILQNPTHIAVLDCPCRSARPNPCLPLDVCLIIGEPFASFIIEHHPQRSRWITPQEAVDIIKAEDARGHVHHAFFKDAMLNRFYAICNCCTCCCGAMQAQRNGTPMLASSGYVCEVDEDLCIACGECNDICPFGALSMGEFSANVNEEKCMGCGICVSHCVQGALSLRRETSKGEPLEIVELMKDAFFTNPLS
ncbi:MAG: 4Fe-4S binding protein [Anaerolineales bacterium]